MNVTAPRPTENAAIGRVRPPQLPPVHTLIRLSREASLRLDRALEHLLDGALNRALQPNGGER